MGLSLISLLAALWWRVVDDVKKKRKRKKFQRRYRRTLLDTPHALSDTFQHDNLRPNRSGRIWWQCRQNCVDYRIGYHSQDFLFFPIFVFIRFKIVIFSNGLILNFCCVNQRYPSIENRRNINKLRSCHNIFPCLLNGRVGGKSKKKRLIYFHYCWCE